MSRRSRRQNPTSTGSSRKAKAGRSLSTWVVRIVLGLLLITALLSVMAYMWMRNYLAGDSFRSLLVTEASKNLHANVELSPLRWDGFRVHANSVEVNGEHQCKSMKWDSIRTGIEPGRVISGTWSVAPTRISKLAILWDSTAKVPADLSDAEPTKISTTKASPWYDSFIPRKFEAEPIIVDSSDIRVILKDGVMRLDETRWQITPTNNLQHASVEATGGKLTLPFSMAPTIRLVKAEATYREGNLFLTECRGSLYERGHLRLTGEWDGAAKTLAVEGDVEEIQCSEILSADWKQKLSGSIHANFKVRSAAEKLDVSGHLNLQNGVLTALPVLDKLAAYSQSMRFRTLALHDAACDFRWKDGIITLTQIKLGSEGLARLEGSCSLRPMPDGDYTLDGNFQLGLAPGTLASIPGAEEEVFLAGARGLRWSSLRLSGTLKNPSEDLSARLMAAAGARMFEILPETGLKVLKYTKQVVEDTAKPAVDTLIKQGSNLTEQGIKQAREVGIDALDTVSDQVGETVNDTIGGVFQGLLGGGNPAPRKQPIVPVPETPPLKK